MRSTVRSDTTRRHLAKYTSSNPIHRYTLGRLFDRVAQELELLAPRSVLDLGCGEGFFLREIERRGIRFADYLGIDARADALAVARSFHPTRRFAHADLSDGPWPEGSFDLVIASQVLEHLPDPAPFLERVTRLTSRHLLLTVPWEPWFRTMNLLRGRDLRRLGNHPEHVNHWTFGEFGSFVSRYARILRATTVFPFTIVVAAPVAQAGLRDRAAR